MTGLPGRSGPPGHSHSKGNSGGVGGPIANQFRVTHGLRGWKNSRRFPPGMEAELEELEAYGEHLLSTIPTSVDQVTYETAATFADSIVLHMGNIKLLDRQLAENAVGQVTVATVKSKKRGASVRSRKVTGMTAEEQRAIIRERRNSIAARDEARAKLQALLVAQQPRQHAHVVVHALREELLQRDDLLDQCRNDTADGIDGWLADHRPDRDAEYAKPINHQEPNQ